MARKQNTLLLGLLLVGGAWALSKKNGNANGNGNGNGVTTGNGPIKGGYTVGPVGPVGPVHGTPTVSADEYVIFPPPLEQVSWGDQFWIEPCHECPPGELGVLTPGEKPCPGCGVTPYLPAPLGVPPVPGAMWLAPRAELGSRVNCGTRDAPAPQPIEPMDYPADGCIGVAALPTVLGPIPPPPGYYGYSVPGLYSQNTIDYFSGYPEASMGGAQGGKGLNLA